MRVAILTQGLNVPSTRFRISQYINHFEKEGMLVEVFHAHSSAYPPAGSLNRFTWLLVELFFRLIQVIKINFSKFDIVIIQRELISTLPTLEFFLTKRFIFDVDDAIYIPRNGLAANFISKRAIAVVCGNYYLSNYFKNHNSNVYELCTPVDTDRFYPSGLVNEQKYIGWSGSSSGFDYLYDIESEIKKTLCKSSGWKLLVVADKPPLFRYLTSADYDFIKWDPLTEVESIQKMTIGIMPLIDNEWTRGKCSYKMLLYMASA